MPHQPLASATDRPHFSDQRIPHLSSTTRGAKPTVAVAPKLSTHPDRKLPPAHMPAPKWPQAVTFRHPDGRVSTGRDTWQAARYELKRSEPSEVRVRW